MPPILDKQDRPILIFDGFNNFLRFYYVCQDVDAASRPIGGTIGVLKFLNALVNQFCPSKIYVVWESGGPSSRRMHLSPNYKGNRNKNKEIQNIQKDGGTIKDALSLDEENKVYQLTILSKMLKTTPICQIFVPNTECDDIIGYMIRNKFKTLRTEKIIVSNDKDFFQLLDDKTVKVYDPAKKALLDDEYVLNRFNISARNFCLAKSIVGDPSDNIEGVPGIGFKMAAKRFEELSDEEKDLGIDFLMDKSKTILESFEGTDKKCPKTYSMVLESEEIIRRNWKLIYLNSSNLSASQIAKVDYIIDNHVIRVDKLGLVKLVIESGINAVFDYDQFCSLLRQFLR